jgi:GNAT superfamily N-acetyltransferase
MTIQQLQPADLARVMVIQQQAYVPQLIESETSFLSKMRLFPQGAFGYRVDGQLAAYLFCHPWRSRSVVEVSDVLAHLPPFPDCLYLHDLAVHPHYRGLGIARTLIEHAFALGALMNLTAVELVAVQDAAAFWKSIGFIPLHYFEYTAGVPATKMRLELTFVTSPHL